MNSLTRFWRFRALPSALCLGGLLLCGSFTVNADEIQEINTLVKQGKQTQALERVDVYLKTKPKDPQARFLKGLILTEQGKTNDAIGQFSSLSEDYPELPEPYNNLAVLYAGQGQYDKAKIALEMAIRTHPSYATAHENLGDIYAKMASQAYDRALKLDRNNTSTQTKLALIKDLFAGNGKSTKSSSRSAANGSAKTQAATSAATPTPDKVADASIDTASTVASTSVAIAAAPASAPSAPVASAPTPAPVATSESTASTVPADTRREEVLKTLKNWAAAWSSKNVNAYLALYAGSFTPPKGQSRRAWDAERTDRIKKPKSIQVTISDAKVSFTDDNHAVVNFRQTYRATHLSTASNKTLHLTKADGKWLIQEEHTGK